MSDSVQYSTCIDIKINLCQTVNSTYLCCSGENSGRKSQDGGAGVGIV